MKTLKEIADLIHDRGYSYIVNMDEYSNNVKLTIHMYYDIPFDSFKAQDPDPWRIIKVADGLNIIIVSNKDKLPYKCIDSLYDWIYANMPCRDIDDSSICPTKMIHHSLKPSHASTDMAYLQNKLSEFIIDHIKEVATNKGYTLDCSKDESHYMINSSPAIKFIYPASGHWVARCDHNNGKYYQASGLYTQLHYKFKPNKEVHAYGDPMYDYPSDIELLNLYQWFDSDGVLPAE